MIDIENKLATAFNEFEELQTQFMFLISKQVDVLLDNLPGWETKRQRKAAILHFLLSSLKKQLDDGHLERERGEEWLNRLKILLSTEDEIYRQLKEIRDNLHCQLSQIKEKKRALIGYHSKNKDGPPLFLSRDA